MIEAHKLEVRRMRLIILICHLLFVEILQNQICIKIKLNFFGKIVFGSSSYLEPSKF